jgi:5-methylcytosine-specific restriction endonuclease McrA
MRKYRPHRPAIPCRTYKAAEPTAAERGYDWAWAKLSQAHRKLHPICQNCKRRRSKETDHIKPFKGRDDPLRLDPNNLQANCTRCHKCKTWRQRALNRIARAAAAAERPK